MADAARRAGQCPLVDAAGVQQTDAAVVSVTVPDFRRDEAG
jgi:hypothetical protein